MAGASTDAATALRKKNMLEALKATFGVITRAAEQVGICRAVHYDWLKEDPEYAAAYAELTELKKDFVESKLLKLVNDGDTAATIFAAKTLCKDRGYVEKWQQEISGPDGTSLAPPVINVHVVGSTPLTDQEG